VNITERLCRNLTINKRRTSLRLERIYWDSLDEICLRERMDLAELCSDIEKQLIGGEPCSLTGALRAYCTKYFRSACTDLGHTLAGHGRRGRSIWTAERDRLERGAIIPFPSRSVL